MGKTHGYLFFYMGVIFMVLSALSMYLVFTANMPPISTFDLPPITLNSDFLKFVGYPNALADTTIEIVPASIVDQFANLFTHLVLMSFIGGIGFKISMLGAYLLRPINIQVKETLQEISAT